MKTEIKLINGDKAIIIDTKKIKTLESDKYKFIFDKVNGLFARWGETENDDGDFELGLPEIADIEISTICSGIGKPCKFCYKSNTPKGEYMNIDTFKKVFDKLPPTITQIAFGIGDIDGNPDLWKIMEHCRVNGIVPNITINGSRMKPDDFDNLAKYCGAVACSVYDKELTYNAIKELADRGMDQINIHFMISEETIDMAYEVMNDIKTDSRLSKMNAIVFLSLKTKGNAKKGFTQLSQEKFNALSDFAITNNIRIGFDSCSSFKFFHSLDVNENLTKEFKDNMYSCVEPCESSVYSSYINVDGKYFPCSFCENVDGWDGLDVIESEDFIRDIWYHPMTIKFRKKLLENKRDCPIYKI